MTSVRIDSPLDSLAVCLCRCARGIFDAYADDVTRDDRSLVHVCSTTYTRSHSIRDRYEDIAVDQCTSWQPKYLWKNYLASRLILYHEVKIKLKRKRTQEKSIWTYLFESLIFFSFYFYSSISDHLIWSTEVDHVTVISVEYLWKTI